jgi:signal transduction histidine kinase
MSSARSVTGQKPHLKPSSDLGPGDRAVSNDIFTRLARAHEACARGLDDRPAGVIVDELVAALQQSLSAKLVVLSATTAQGQVVGASPVEGYDPLWLDTLRARYVEASTSAATLFALSAEEASPPGIPREDLASFLALRLSGEGIEGMLWLGLGEGREAIRDQIGCFGVLGAHVTLVLERVFTGRRSAPPPPSGLVMAHGGEANTLGNEELIAMAAHELRTPLTPLTMLLHSLERKAKNGLPDAEAVGRARRQVDRLTQMVADLLDLSRLRRNLLALSCEPVELGDAVYQAAQSFQELHANHHVELPAPPEPLCVIADEKRLHRSLLSLFEHVARIAPSGDAIAVDVTRRGDQAVVALRSRRERPSTSSQPDSPEASLSGSGEASNARANQLKNLACHLAESLIRRQGGIVTTEHGPQGDPSMVATFPLRPPP